MLNILRKHKYSHPHGSIRTANDNRVPHYLAVYNPLKDEFTHTETGEPVLVKSVIDYNYACYLLLTQTVLLNDGTTMESSQISCDPKTGECVQQITGDPVELKPNQVHLVIIDYSPEKSCTLENILQEVNVQLCEYRESEVKIKKIYLDGWCFGFYRVEYDDRSWIESINFNQLRLTKVVKVSDGGDFHFFYSKISPEYNAFGSPNLFEIIRK